VIHNQGIDPAEAFSAYLSVRHRLPKGTGGGGALRANFMDIVAPFDLILFDAYGVLNIGEAAIRGAADTVAKLRSVGKSVAIVSNSAAYPKANMMARYATLGFDFAETEVVTSRDVLLEHLKREPQRRWGLMLNPDVDLGEFTDLDAVVLTDAPEVYDQVDGFLLIGADGWTERRQNLLEAALIRTPRPVFVGNPDLVAPRESGLSLEPGWFALVMASFGELISPKRVLMVGDTLHTDILGGHQSGFATALVTAHGSLVGLDVENAVETSRITPDFIVEHI
jgi:glycerol 3-phosphatase-2